MARDQGIKHVLSLISYQLSRVTSINFLNEDLRTDLKNKSQYYLAVIGLFYSHVVMASRLLVSLVLIFSFIAILQVIKDCSQEWVPDVTEVQEKNVFKDFKYNETESSKPLLRFEDPLERYLATHFVKPITEEKSYQELSHRIRLLKGINETTELYQFLFKSLFPWITNFSKQTKKPRGIVISVGNEFGRCAEQAIMTIRALNCTLPIVIAYGGVFDLDSTERLTLTELGATVMNICDIFNCVELDLDRWDGKPFALLASHFDETILMDADTVFVQNPETLFSDEGYLKSGALFFHDRTMFPGNYQLSQWISEVMPKPISEEVKSMRIFRAQSYYEQESGVVVMNNIDHYYGLLAICALNTPGLKEPIRANTHGEKETFWMGMEVAGESYEFMPGMPGSIGRIETKGRRASRKPQICGHLAHFDRIGNMLWFNDGLASSKRESDEFAIRQAATLTHYGREGEHGRWSDDLCLIGELFAVPDLTNAFITRVQQLNGLHL